MNKLFKCKKIGLLVFLIFSLNSCSNNSNYESNVIKTDVVGELKHTEYWNKNDEWDLKGLFVHVRFSDGNDKNFDFQSNYVMFKCDPILPIDGISELKIIDIYYKDYLGTSHLVANKLIFKISVVNYPYDFVNIDGKKLIIPSIFVIIFVLFVIIYFIKKRKEI